MVNNISWTSYWYFIVLSVAIYYFIIALLYYGRDLTFLAKGLRRRLSNGNLQSAAIPFRSDQRTIANGFTELNHHLDGDIDPIVKSFLDEMTAYLEQAGQAGNIREEIIFSVQQLVKKYGRSNLISSEASINNMLQNECLTRCSVDLSRQEIEMVWRG